MGKIEIRTVKDFERAMQCICGSEMTYLKIKWNLKKEIAEFEVRCVENWSHKGKRTISPYILLKCAPEDMVADFFDVLVELKSSYKRKGIGSYPDTKAKYLEILKQFESSDALKARVLEMEAPIKRQVQVYKRELEFEARKNYSKRTIKQATRYLMNYRTENRVKGINMLVSFIKQYPENKYKAIELIQSAQINWRRSDATVKRAVAEAIEDLRAISLMDRREKILRGKEGVEKVIKVTAEDFVTRVFKPKAEESVRELFGRIFALNAEDYLEQCIRTCQELKELIIKNKLVKEGETQALEDFSNKLGDKIMEYLYTKVSVECLFQELLSGKSLNGEKGKEKLDVEPIATFYIFINFLKFPFEQISVMEDPEEVAKFNRLFKETYQKYLEEFF